MLCGALEWPRLASSRTSRHFTRSASDGHCHRHSPFPSDSFCFRRQAVLAENLRATVSASDLNARSIMAASSGSLAANSRAAALICFTAYLTA